MSNGLIEKLSDKQDPGQFFHFDLVGGGRIQIPPEQVMRLFNDLQSWIVISFDPASQTYVGKCPLLGIMSAGETEAEAFAATCSAVRLSFESVKRQAKDTVRAIKSLTETVRETCALEVEAESWTGPPTGIGPIFISGWNEALRAAARRIRQAKGFAT